MINNTFNYGLKKDLDFNLLQKVGLRSSNKHVALPNLSIYYTYIIIRQQYKNNKLKIIAPTSNDEFNCLMALVQCLMFKIISITSKNTLNITH